jgi:AAA family ATP:ADP antiporter
MGFLTRFFGILPGETKKTILLFVYLFLLVAGFIMAKSVRDGLFLTQSSPLNLPYVYIAVALFMGLAVTLYSRISRHFRLQNAIAGMQVFVAITLILFWYLFSSFRNHFSYGLFYVWVSIFGAISMSQFWLIASELNDSRSAKRLFGPIGSGGILGGVAGGFAAKWIAESRGTESLVVVVAVLYLICSLLVKIVYEAGDSQTSQRNKEDGAAIGSGWKALKDFRYLQWITIVLFITELISTFVDFQFKMISRNAFPQKNELTAFLGSFYGYLNIANFLLQAFLTNRIINWAGMKGASLILPFTLLTGSAGLFFIPALWTAIWLKVGDDGLRHSLNRFVMELLYLPVPTAVREKAKLFVDSFAVQSATGLGGLVLLLYIRHYAANVAPLAALVFTLCVVWIVISLITHSEYVNAFREGLKKRAIDVESVSLEIVDIPTLETLIQALNSTDERVVLYAVDLLQRGGKGYLISPWLLHHPSPKVRIKIVEIISQRSDRSAIALLKGAIRDESVEVQAEALQTICLLEPEAQEEMVLSLSYEKDPKLRRAAILCAALGSPEHQQQAHRWLEEMIESTRDEGTLMRMEAAKALAKLPSPFHDLFPVLFSDSDKQIVREAIRSAAVTKNGELIPFLVKKLGDRRLKAEARGALLKYSPEIIRLLDQYLDDETIPLWGRRHIPRTIGGFGSQNAADTLFRRFDHPDHFIRNKILKSLNQLRALHSEFSFDRHIVEQRLFQEVEDYFNQLARKLAIFSVNGSKDGNNFLTISLDRRLDASFDRIFRFLALVYPHRDVFNAYSSLKSKEPTFRNAAIEYMDNSLERSIRRVILPIIDNIPDSVKLNQVNSFLSIQKRGADDALLELLKGTDSWLSACAIYWIYQQKRQDLYPHLQPLIDRNDPLIQETITWASQLRA